MGKIRSTLDIVMERTRGVSMSLDERERIRDRELSDEARAWTQRYLDGKWSWEDLQARLDSSGDDRRRMASALGRQLASEIRLGAGNAPVIDALSRLSGSGRQRIEEIVGELEQELRILMASHRERLRLELDGRGIRGDAVIPNVEKDPDWQEAAGRIQERVCARLGEVLPL